MDSSHYKPHPNVKLTVWPNGAHLRDMSDLALALRADIFTRPETGCPPDDNPIARNI